MAGFQFLSGLVLVSVTVSVYSFIIGAPPDTCGNPTTFHTEPLNETHVGQYLAQNSSTAPYKVIIDTKFYENETYSKILGKQNNRVRVTLKADPGDYFRGFFIQATRANFALDRGDRPAYGTFRPADTNSQPRRCRSAVGKVGGITHTGNNNKTEISFDWEPPRGCNLGDIQFVATVVRAYSEYWVDVRSDVISPSGFVGDRGLLCQLYVNPYSKILQRRVLSALRNIQNMQQRGGRRGNRAPAQG